MSEREICKKTRVNSIKIETPVCHDVLLFPDFQVHFDKGWVRGLLIMNFSPALFKHLTPLSHI
jgi:hypothetical protein